MSVLTMSRTSIPRARWLAVVLGGLLAACATGPYIQPPDEPGAVDPAPDLDPLAPDPRPAFDTPEEALDAFLEFYFDTYGSGLPTGAERRALEGILTADFLRAIDLAAAADRCSREASRGQDPPLVQGDVFSSLDDKATSVTSVEELAATEDDARYALHFEHRPSATAPPEVAWNDEVTLHRAGEGWHIDDFERGGDGQFMTQGSVKAMLRGVAGLCPSR